LNWGIQQEQTPKEPAKTGIADEDWQKCVTLFISVRMRALMPHT